MKRETVLANFGVGERQRAVVVIDKNGLSVKNKSQECCYSDDDFIASIIYQAIDCGDWKYSWHVSVRNAKLKGSKERKEIRKIIDEKINEVENLKQLLKDAKNVLGRWKY